MVLSLVALAACIPPLAEPGKTGGIKSAGTFTEDGWRYDFYRNEAYPCAGSGFQTFVIATPVGVPRTEVRPMWVYMHGGGVGYFDSDGDPQPSIQHKTEESAAELRLRLQQGDLIPKVRADRAGFRLMAVSMCDHDFYGGPDIDDPNNRGTTPDGEPITVNGLYATKAAIAFARGLHRTNDYFLHGTSAGSVGSYHMAWGLQQQGLAPTGTVSDSGLLNWRWIDAKAGAPCVPTADAQTEILKRLHPDIVDRANSPDRLVADGRLTVPILQVWTRGDPLFCGLTKMNCPVPGGSVPTVESVDCLNEPLKRAIAAQGPASRSLSMRLCVNNPRVAGACDMHVPTARTGSRNSQGPWPPDFTMSIMDWVRLRLADD